MAVNTTGLVGIGPTPEIKSAVATAASGANTSVVSAVTAKAIAVTAVTLTSTAATVTLCELKDGSGGSTKWEASGFGGGISSTAPAGGYLFKGTSNTALYLFVAAGTGSAYVSVSYVEIDP